ncbi:MULTISPECIES: hypothetical protein [Staphylococcus]|nr:MULTISPECIES: hypothetical protein [Staphylococcus]
MKNLTEKELKSINAGDFWEDLGTATGTVIDKIPKFGKGKNDKEK